MANILLTERQLKIITNEILKKEKSGKKTLNESLLSLENVLMAAGFVPVIGEVADIALIIYYLYKKEYLYAALMLIALIPTVGDFIVKPIIKLFKGSREGALALKGGAELSEYLAKNPELAKKFSSLGKYVNDTGVQKTVQGIEKMSPSLGSKLKSGLEMITGSKALTGLKAGSKEVMAGGAFKTGLKDYFQGERLAKYFEKHGVLPETGIKKWWLNVGARQDRRNAFRQFISANNLLNYFGIPSITTFERKMSDDAAFREKVANDPKTSDYIAQNFQKEDMVNQTSNDFSKQEIDDYIKQRNAGKSFSSIFGGSSSNVPSAQGNDGILNIIGTIFGGSPKLV